MENLEKNENTSLEVQNSNTEIQNNKIEISPELYSKVISIYNEFVRKYHVKDEDVNLKIYCKQGQLDRDIYNNIIKDAIAQREELSLEQIKNVYQDKINNLHDLKMESYKENLQNGEIAISPERLTKIIEYEKDIKKLKDANNIDTSIEAPLIKEEKIYEAQVNKTLNNSPENLKERNEKLDQIENQMAELNKQKNAGLISKEEYANKSNMLEKDKTNLVWGITLLDSSLLKEKYIDDKVVVKSVENNLENKELNNVQLNEVENKGLEVNALENKELNNVQLNEVENKGLESNALENKELNNAQLNEVENKDLEVNPTENNIEQVIVETEEITTTTTTTTTTIENREEVNEFIIELQSKVLINQNPENIVQIVRCQEARDLSKGNSIEREIER